MNIEQLSNADVTTRWYTQTSKSNAYTLYIEKEMKKAKKKERKKEKERRKEQTHKMGEKDNCSKAEGHSGTETTQNKEKPKQILRECPRETPWTKA